MTAQMDERKISLAITTYQEFEKLIASFIQVIDDERISEIVIVDDCSDEETAFKLTDWLEFDAPEQKIKLCQNTKHIGEHLSKHTAVVMADEEWVLLASPDSIFDKKILDKMFGQCWNYEIDWEISSGIVLVHRAEYLRTFKIEAE